MRARVLITRLIDARDLIRAPDHARYARALCPFDARSRYAMRAKMRARFSYFLLDYFDARFDIIMLIFLILIYAFERAMRAITARYYARALCCAICAYGDASADLIILLLD